MSQYSFCIRNDSQIYDYLNKDFSRCLYIYLDYQKYGLDNENIIEDSTKYEKLDISTSSSTGTEIRSFYDKLYSKNDPNCFGGILVLKDSLSNPVGGDDLLILLHLLILKLHLVECISHYIS